VANVHLAVWLLFLEDGRLMDSFFGGVHVPFNCRFLVAQTKDDAVELTEVYRVTGSHPLSVRRCGFWKDDRLIFCKGSLYESRSNLQGLTMRAISMDVSWVALCVMSFRILKLTVVPLYKKE
jgi:hypothetical protein